jgi:molybdopterin converting factor small subunit
VDGDGTEPPADPVRGGRGLAVVLLPSLLAAEAGGRGRFETDATTVAEALRGLPIADLLLDGRGALRPLVNVYVDGVDARERDGLDTRLEGGEEIRVLAAIAGG